jgi:hypothetical protein
VFILFSLSVNTVLAVEIYSTDFDTGTLISKNGFKWTDGAYAGLSSNNSKSGDYSLQFHFKGGAPGKDSWAEQRFSLGGFYPEVWAKYDLYIPANYYHRKDSPSNNKAFTWLWAGPYVGHEGPKLGGQFNPGSFDDGGSNFIAFAEAAWQNGGPVRKEWNCSTCAAGKSNYAITPNDRGHWMTIVTHMKYASKSNNDGVMEIWKTDWQGNTIQLVDIQDGAWYSTIKNSTEPARGFDNGYLLGWANSGFDSDTYMYIDNITFSTDPLKNVVSGPSPKPPIPTIE